MMTFLVHGDFIINASMLDNQRLGKQRIEARQIINTIEQNGKAWRNHPIVIAWFNHVDGLKYYTNCIILEWIKRGYKNNMELYQLPQTVVLPWWSQWDKLHYSHQAMLLRKNPFYYSFDVPDEYHQFGYIWPNNVTDPNASLEDLAAEIPKDLINPIYCSAILKKGGICGRLIKIFKSDNKYCKIHAVK